MDKKIDDRDLDAVYKYLSVYYETLSEPEKLFWIELLDSLDPEFNDIDDETPNSTNP